MSQQPEPDTLRSALDADPDAADLFGELVAADPADPVWLSAIRGRVLAAIASAVSLWVSGGHLLGVLAAIRTGGLDPAAGAELLTHAGVVYDAGASLIVASGSLVALVASVGSKARELARRLGRG
jgi:hypothetical protein